MHALSIRLAVLLVVLASAAPAQVLRLGSPSSGGVVTFSPPQRGPLPVIVDAPYSAEEVFESVLIRPDGKPGTSEPRRKMVFRDSQGRARTEWTLRVVSYPERKPHDTPVIEIIDPVAGFAYVLDAKRRVAHRMKLPAFRTVRPRPLTPPPSGPGSPFESLGQQVIDGEMAEGQRFTAQAGVQNDGQPLFRTTETWRVVDLGVTLLIKTHDPIGDHATRLTNLKRGEPDPKLFEAPEGYTVLDEAGAFVIDYSTP